VRRLRIAVNRKPNNKTKGDPENAPMSADKTPQSTIRHQPYHPSGLKNSFVPFARPEKWTNLGCLHPPMSSTNTSGTFLVLLRRRPVSPGVEDMEREEWVPTSARKQSSGASRTVLSMVCPPKTIFGIPANYMVFLGVWALFRIGTLAGSGMPSVSTQHLGSVLHSGGLYSNTPRPGAITYRLLGFLPYLTLPTALYHPILMNLSTITPIPNSRINHQRRMAQYRVYSTLVAYPFGHAPPYT